MCFEAAFHPLSEPSIKHCDIPSAKYLQIPPSSAGMYRTASVVTHHQTIVLGNSEAAHGLAKGFFVGEHEGKAGGGVGDFVNVEKVGVWETALEEMRVGGGKAGL